MYVLACVLVLSSTACNEEFLEVVPADQPTVDGFYNNETQIRAATASLYGRPWFEYNDKFSWAAGDGLAGDLYNDYQDEGQLFFFSFSDNNQIISQAWRSLYNVVAYTNAIINDMPPVAASKGVPQEAIERGIAEAKVFRALAYYLLTEYWGEVPIVENAAQLVTNNEMDLPKNTRESVLEFIIRDLQYAAENLPESDEAGRVTEYSAKGLLAKVYLTRAQQTKSPADFEAAKTYALDVIQNSGASLVPNYADLFKIANNNNPETLIALQWINGAWGFGNSRQAVFARSGQITNNSEAWGGGKSATLSFMENLQQNAGTEVDERRPAIYMTLNDYYPEIRKNDGGYTYLFVNNAEDGTNLEYAPAVLNNIKKYVVGSAEDVGVTVNNQAVPLNQYMLRLADVYLIYAEAVLGTAESTTDATALQYYNAVRERAGLAPRSSLTFRDIFNERRVEFGMEGINWLDVKRWSYRNQAAALAYLNEQDRGRTYQATPDETDDSNTWEAYVVVEPETPVLITEGDLVLPIPNGEVTNNPLLAPSADAVEYTFE